MNEDATFWELKTRGIMDRLTEITKEIGEFNHDIDMVSLMQESKQLMQELTDCQITEANYLRQSYKDE